MALGEHWLPEPTTYLLGRGLSGVLRNGARR